ncbi:MAG: L-threonylcarbamoyladenylate synthase, partial [Pseudomonadota bacterium]
GGLVAFPTETVYGLGADATNGDAIARLYATKHRPLLNPLIVHVAEPVHARRYGMLDDRALQLTDAFWPGPLTLVVPQRSDSPIASLATAGLDTVALRCSAHPVARALIAAAGCPVVAPSANRSGGVSATLAEHVAADFDGQDIVVIDGGASPIGVESTVAAIMANGVVLLRAGAVLVNDIAGVVGAEHVVDRRDRTDDAAPNAPGQLTSHYAPQAPVRLNASQVNAGEALLGFGVSMPPTTGRALNLSASGSLEEAAAHLFAHLRALDAMNPTAIAVMPIPDVGLGQAINDRLRRAAAPTA